MEKRLGGGNDCSTLDDDKDGVSNCADKCPDTPKGAIVDKDGCWAFHGVLFDFDSDKVKSKYDPQGAFVNLYQKAVLRH